jgi:AmmeMemoRadiSam system protein A
VSAHEEGRKLLAAARRELHQHFGLHAEGEDLAVEWPFPLGGVFATLELEGELRGCIGYFQRDESVLALTRRAVVAAAVDDPRFRQVSREEVTKLSIGLTVLAPPERVTDVREIEIGRDGLLIERGSARGLLLPQVAEKRRWDRERFLSETCRKAGLPEDAWRDGVTVVRRFEAMYFSDR